MKTIDELVQSALTRVGRIAKHEDQTLGDFDLNATFEDWAWIVQSIDDNNIMTDFKTYLEVEDSYEHGHMSIKMYNTHTRTNITLEYDMSTGQSWRDFFTNIARHEEKARKLDAHLNQLTL